MSDKLRSVNTRFWEDPFVEGLTPTEKLIFLYLLTNPLTNLIGIYEITTKRISYDTSVPKESIEKALKGFQTVNKVLMIDNFIVLPNFLKNQSLNENMKIGVVKLFKSLPNYLKERLLGNDYPTIQNDYISLLNGLLKLNGIEREKESEDEIINTWRNDFQIYFSECKAAYDKFLSDPENIKKQEHLNPGINVRLSIEKGFTNFWSLEAGWKHKKKSRSNEIDWNGTIINSIGLNKVYYSKEEIKNKVEKPHFSYGPES